MQPGVYYGGWEIQNNVTLELAKGVYIIAGGGIKLNAGGSITSVQGGAGTPVADPPVVADIVRRGWGYAKAGYQDIQPDRINAL